MRRQKELNLSIFPIPVEKDGRISPSRFLRLLDRGGGDLADRLEGDADADADRREHAVDDMDIADRIFGGTGLEAKVVVGADDFAVAHEDVAGAVEVQAVAVIFSAYLTILNFRVTGKADRTLGSLAVPYWQAMILTSTGYFEPGGIGVKISSLSRRYAGP